MHSKRKEKQTLFKFQNLQNKNFRTRCVAGSKSQSSPRLLNYYKDMCKSSRCYFHRNSALNRKSDIIFKKKMTRKKNTLENQKQKLRMPDHEVLYLADDIKDNTVCMEYDSDLQLHKKIERSIVELDHISRIKFENILGHRLLKEMINRTVIWPLKKPELFKGLRSAPKGILLFGPPGTGKTLIGRWIALETESTFFNVSPSTLISKWMGESEKLVKTMFIVAKERQPSIIFIDEVDTILPRTTFNENRSSLKNEFLVHMDGSKTETTDRVLVVGVTHKPQELDEAARRRFVKRFYVPLPDETDRKELLLKFLKRECHSLQEIDINNLVAKTEGYSAADIKSLSQEAAMGPIKSISPKSFIFVKPDQVRPISMEDFLCALQLIKPSISKEEVMNYESWNLQFGYGGEKN